MSLGSQQAMEMPYAAASSLGATAWFDLPVTDLADAMSFYEGLFGWTYRQMEETPVPHYVMICAGDRLIGGLREVKRSPSSAPAPLLYFTTPNLAAAVARAQELGATLDGSRVMLGEGRGSYQWIIDRSGNRIGLWAK